MVAVINKYIENFICVLYSMLTVNDEVIYIAK